MSEHYEERSERLAEYMIEHNATVRSAARHFGISKSTVHKDLSFRLQHYNKSLFKQVRQVLDANMATRHIRGGNATRAKYSAIKRNRS